MNLNDILIDPRQTVSVEAQGVIAAGDLVTMIESGKVAKAAETLGIAGENITTAGATAIRAMKTLEADVDYGQSLGSHECMCALGSGNVAFVYAGDGTTVSTNLNLRIRSVAGIDVIARTTLVTSTGIDCARCLRISDTQFVVAYTKSGLKFQVVNNDGTVAVAETSVATLYGSQYYYWNIALLASGEFVFVYSKTGAGDCCFARYNAAGALQGAETTIESAATPEYIGLIGCADGDFVTTYRRTAATAAYKTARYDATGAQVGSLVSFATGVNKLDNNAASYGLAELSNGNVAMSVPGTGDAYPDVYILNNNHVQQTQIDFGTSNIQQREQVQIVATPGKFAVIYRNALTKTGITVLSNTGLTILSHTEFGAAGGGSAVVGQPPNGVHAFALEGVGYAVFRNSYDSTNYEARLIVIDESGVVLGSEVVLRANAAGAIYLPSMCLTDAGTIALMFKDWGSPYLADAYYHVQRRSVLGVANAAATAGDTVAVKTRGSYTINQAMTFGGTFDGTAATVLGTKGAVSGTTAILQGVSA